MGVEGGWNGRRELRGTKLPVIKYRNYGDVMYSIGNIVNDIGITLYGERW